jgi:flagellum-specific ATP synthase
MNLALDKYFRSLDQLTVEKDIGRVVEVSGMALRGYVSGCSVGSLCEVESLMGQRKFLAEVIGFDRGLAVLMALGEVHGVGPGSRIEVKHTKSFVSVGPELLGRVVDGMGQPLDGLGELYLGEEAPLYSQATNPLERDIIREPLTVGVRAIDGLLSLGKGQRAAILAGSGVGKSVLLGMMAQNTDADVNVIALIGERGREVKEFIEHSLGPEGLKKSVIVAVTSDQSAIVRTRGAFYATAIAEHFALAGKNVLLMMDSVTRFAMAQREIGLNVGEPPTTKAYTPSVFAILPRLLERAGHFKNSGSITGLYTVLVEGDDMNEPIADAVRSIVDGHIVLDRKIAQRAHFPAIDILQSTSRVMRNVVSDEHQALAQEVRRQIAIYREAEDLINIGAYRSGANPRIDSAIRCHESIDRFLQQKIGEKTQGTLPVLIQQALRG